MASKLFTLYCDDIRQELGGKVSYIGAYTAKMMVQSFPAFLPKFGILAVLTIPREKAFKKVTFKVYKGDTLIAETEAGDEERAPFEEQLKQDLESGSYSNMVSIKNHFMFAPFFAEEAGVIKVHAEIEGKTIKGNSLIVEQAPEGTEFPGP